MGDYILGASLLMFAATCVVMLVIKEYTRLQQLALGAIIGTLVVTAIDSFVGGISAALFVPMVVVLLVIGIGALVADQFGHSSDPT